MIKYSISSTITAFLCCFLLNQINAQSQKDNKTVTSSKWFPYFDFDSKNFQQTSRDFGPFTRWWLPGNDITSEELQREIKLFAENGFAGVEVQPLTMGLNPNAPQAQMDRIYSWDTPSFYEHLRAIMQQAQASKVIVDMNAGSGWPLGGSFFDPNESMRTLAVVDSLLVSNSLYNGALPMVKFHKLSDDKSDINLVKPQWGIIKSVIAAKVINMQDNQMVLDQKSIVNLTDKVKNNNLNWRIPSGQNWRLIVSYSIPTGEKPSLIASKGVNYVIDHLDPKVVNKTYS